MHGKIMHVIITFAILVDGGIFAVIVLLNVNAHAFFWTGWATHLRMILPSALFLATQPRFLRYVLWFHVATF